MAAPPPDPDRLTALWRAVGDRPLAAAVSGGGDSLALLAALRRAAPGRPLHALIVDHAIQPGSDRVAAEAAQRAKAMGVEPHIQGLEWPAGAVKADQAAARDRRYRALAGMAKALGASVLAVAHTRDDQAETALIKRARTGRWGEAGMSLWAPCPVWPEGAGLALARPFLGVSRPALRAWAQAEGLVWHEDPANQNPAFLRVRARAVISADPAFAARLAAHADRAAEAAARLNGAALAWIGRSARFDDLRHGRVRLSRLPEDRAGRRGLSVLLGAVAGDPAAAPPEGVKRLLKAVHEGAPAAALGGALLRRTANTFVISRDPGALKGRAGRPPKASVTLIPCLPTIIDGRFALSTDTPGYEVAVAPDAQWALRRDGHWIALNAADDVSVRWLTEVHVRHVLGPANPCADCDAFKGVQQPLGLLS